MQSLTEKYGRKSLHAIYGQSAIVESLRAFVRAPHSHAFLFHGGPGVGKSACAMALAHELGIDPDQNDWGWSGWKTIDSGECTAEAVRETWKELHTRPRNGSGWKLCLADEIDSMSKKAEDVWCNVLDEGKRPPMSVYVFTTNHVGKLPERFRQRCEQHEFTNSAAILRDSIRRACVQIWRAEGMSGDPPGLATMGINGATASFRAAYRALELAIRTAKSARPTLAKGAA
jgi:replication factor C small subunit